MEDILSVFVETYYLEDVQEEINKSFDSFDFFDHNLVYAKLIDMCHQQGSISTDDLQDSFLATVHEGLDYILSQHTVKLVADVSLNEKNQLVAALGFIQRLVDYSAIIRTLETFADDIEQFSSIISELTLMDETRIHSLIESIEPSMMRTLKDYAYQRTDELQAPDSETLTVLENYPTFTKFIQSQALGCTLVSQGMLVGDRFETYLGYVESNLIAENNPQQTAANILSVLYMSIDGYNAPLLTYRKHSLRILHDLNLVSKVEVKLLDLIARYTEYMKVLNEKTRLSQASV